MTFAKYWAAAVLPAGFDSVFKEVAEKAYLAAQEDAQLRLQEIGDAFVRVMGGSREGKVLGAMIAEGVTQLDSYIEAAVDAARVRPPVEEEPPAIAPRTEFNSKRFFWRATVSGGLCSNFVFEDKSSLMRWEKVDFPALMAQYGPLNRVITRLPGLTLGDACYVVGEGDDVFRILDLHQYSPHRYAFVLDSGFREEVAKCYS